MCCFTNIEGDQELQPVVRCWTKARLAQTFRLCGSNGRGISPVPEPSGMDDIELWAILASSARHNRGAGRLTAARRANPASRWTLIAVCCAMFLQDQVTHSATRVRKSDRLLERMMPNSHVHCCRLFCTERCVYSNNYSAPSPILPIGTTAIPASQPTTNANALGNQVLKSTGEHPTANAPPGTGH